MYDQGPWLVRKNLASLPLTLLGKETIIRLNGLIGYPPKLIEKANRGCRDYYRS